MPVLKFGGKTLPLMFRQLEQVLNIVEAISQLQNEGLMGRITMNKINKVIESKNHKCSISLLFDLYSVKVIKYKKKRIITKDKKVYYWRTWSLEKDGIEKLRQAIKQYLENKEKREKECMSSNENSALL